MSNTTILENKCKISVYSGGRNHSGDLIGDICSYHRERLAQVVEVRCDCGESWTYLEPVVPGMKVPPHLSAGVTGLSAEDSSFLEKDVDINDIWYSQQSAKEYYGIKEENLCFPHNSKLYCCIEAITNIDFYARNGVENIIHQCGAINICADCVHKHTSSYRKTFLDLPPPLPIYPTYQRGYHPEIHFSQLVGRKDKYGYQSLPNNPACKLSGYGCSEEMASSPSFLSSEGGPNLCYWHRHRMGYLREASCRCQKWKIVDGDSPGRRMVRDYYDLDYDTTPCIDSSGRLYCCGKAQSADLETHICPAGTPGGPPMRVCRYCLSKHENAVPITPNKNSDASEDESYGYSDW